MRVRLKANVDLSTFPPDVQLILTALKKYGMILADNGGGFFVSGAPDPRWNDANIDTMKRTELQAATVGRFGKTAAQWTGRATNEELREALRTGEVPTRVATSLTFVPKLDNGR